MPRSLQPPVDKWDAIAGCQAAEVRCLCAGLIDVVAVGMTKPENLHSTFTSSPSAAFVVPEDIDCQLPQARAMPTPPEAVKWRLEWNICD
jgi:hypothetical protein